MMLEACCIASAVCAAVPAALTVLNLREYRPPPAVDAAAGDGRDVSVIIPARNETEGIAACVEMVLAQVWAVEVIVVDDGSTDGTAEIVRGIAARDTRVRLLAAGELPGGWNGKQHACWVGAGAAGAGMLCFLDADVRLKPHALQRTGLFAVRERAALVSGFPRELTGTLLEKLLIPLIHFVLLGLLPMSRLRKTNKPAFAAGCGQFLLVDRAAYFASGGHAGIRMTMHDGLLLPKLLRQHGYSTRLVDMTMLAECRMYQSAAATWSGLAKNATEGLAAPARIVPFTLLLGLGQVIPLVLLVLAWLHTSFIIPFLGPPIRIGLAPVYWAAAAVALSYLPRVINSLRYRQSWLGAILHPFGVAILLLLQWFSLLRKLAGRPATWKARDYVIL